MQFQRIPIFYHPGGVRLFAISQNIHKYSCGFFTKRGIFGESGGKGDAKAPPPSLRSPGTVRGASGDAAPYMAGWEASLVKGRWTPKAAGGILAAWPLMPLSRQPGRNPSASQSSAPPFDKGGFTKFKLFYNNVTIFERIWPCFCGKIFV